MSGVTARPVHDIVALEVRLADSDPHALARALRGEGAELLADAVERSAAVLEADPDQLAAQLAGRLGSALAPEFFAGRARPWLRPLTVSLEPPRSPLRMTLREHGAEVRAVLVTADGATLLSSAEDGRVLRWDLESGECLGGLLGHESTVNAMTFTPDGELLLTSSDDHTIGVWSARDWRLLRRLRGHAGYVRRTLALADGRAVSASNDGTLRVWDLASGETVRVISGHGTTVTALALVGGDRVAAASTNNLIAVWDLATGERVHTLFDGSDGHHGEIMGLTLSTPNESGVGHRDFPNRMWIGADGGLYSAQREIVRWDVKLGVQASRGAEHGWPIADVAVGSSGLSATASDTVRLLDPDGSTRAVLHGHEGHVTAVTFSPDGRTLVSGGDDHSLRVWDVGAALLAPAPQRHSGWVDNIVASPDRERCVTFTSDGVARLWHLASGAHERAFTHEPPLLSAACFTPDGARLVVTSSSGELWVWELASGALVADGLWKNYWFQGIAPTPDGARLVTGGVNTRLATWDILKTGGQPRLFEPPAVQVTGLALTPDGRYAVVVIYVYEGAGELQVWDVEAGVLHARHVAGDKERLHGVLLADGGRLACTTTGGGRLRVLELPTAKVVHDVTVGGGWISRIVALPGGQVLAGSIEDGTAVLREVDVLRGEVGRERRVALADGGRAPELRGLGVSADGRRALVVADWSARLVDLEGGEVLARFVGDAKIVSGQIRADGRGAIVGEEGGRVHVLELVGA